MREAYSLVVKERGSVVPPTVVVDSRGVEVDIDEFYGEPFVRKRIIGKGGAVPSPDPVSPKNAIKVKPATADTSPQSASPFEPLVPRYANHQFSAVDRCIRTEGEQNPTQHVVFGVISKNKSKFLHMPRIIEA